MGKSNGRADVSLDDQLKDEQLKDERLKDEQLKAEQQEHELPPADPADGFEEKSPSATAQGPVATARGKRAGKAACGA